MDEKRESTFAVFRWLRAALDAEVPPAAYKVVVALTLAMDSKTGLIQATSYKALAERTGQPERNLKRHCAVLIASKLLEHKRGGQFVAKVPWVALNPPESATYGTEEVKVPPMALKPPESAIGGTEGPKLESATYGTLKVPPMAPTPHTPRNGISASFSALPSQAQQRSAGAEAMAKDLTAEITPPPKPKSSPPQQPEPKAEYKYPNLPKRKLEERRPDPELERDLWKRLWIKDDGSGRYDGTYHNGPLREYLAHTLCAASYLELVDRVTGPDVRSRRGLLMHLVDHHHRDIETLGGEPDEGRGKIPYHQPFVREEPHYPYHGYDPNGPKITREEARKMLDDCIEEMDRWIAESPYAPVGPGRY